MEFAIPNILNLAVEWQIYLDLTTEQEHLDDIVTFNHAVEDKQC